MSLIPRCLCRGMHPPLEQVSQSSSSAIWSWDKPTASSHPPSQSFGHKDSWYNCPKVTPSLNHCSGKMLSTRQKKRHFVFFSFLQSKLQDLKLGISKRHGLSLRLGKLGTSSCLQWPRPLVLGLGLWGAANIAPERGMGAGHARKTHAGGPWEVCTPTPFLSKAQATQAFFKRGFTNPKDGDAVALASSSLPSLGHQVPPLMGQCWRIQLSSLLCSPQPCSAQGWLLWPLRLLTCLLL